MNLRIILIAFYVFAAIPAIAQTDVVASKRQDQITQTSISPSAGVSINAAALPADVISTEHAGDRSEAKSIRVSADSSCVNSAALPRDAAKELVRRIATEENFYPDFVLSVAKIESRYNSIARSGDFFGLMQISADTAGRFKVDRCDPADNVRGGVRLLRVLHERYRNPFFILAAWKSGEQALSDNNGIPPDSGTLRFIAAVMNDFYGWAPIGVDSSTASRAGARPGQAPALPQKPSEPAKSSDAAWSDGFVMHVR